MTGDIIPDKDNISRYCSSINAPDGEIQASAFILRGNEETLSVNWLDYFKSLSKEDQIAEIRKVYALKKLNHRKGKIVVLNVGEVRNKINIARPGKVNLIVRHSPSTNDESHSEVYNLKEDNELIAELILETIIENHPACL